MSADDAVSEHETLQRLALSDPYVAVSYSGVEGLTDLMYAEYNPVFFQDIIYNIEVRHLLNCRGNRNGIIIQRTLSIFVL